MNNIFKRVLSLLLVLVMLISLAPVSVFADETAETEETAETVETTEAAETVEMVETDEIPATEESAQETELPEEEPVEQEEQQVEQAETSAEETSAEDQESSAQKQEESDSEQEEDELASYESDTPCSLSELTSVDYAAFSSLAYKSLTAGKTVKESIGDDWNSSWEETSFKYSDLFSHVSNWTVSNIAKDESNGFYAAALTNGQGEYVVAYRGSESFTKVFTDEDARNDWINNDLPAEICNMVTEASQIPDAMAFYNAISEKASDVSVTGHSLGGGLADVVAAANNCYGESVNAISLIDCAFATFPTLMHSFNGVDNWSFFDHVNEHDVLAGKWGDDYKPHDSHESLFAATSLFDNHRIKSMLDKSTEDGTTTVEFTDVTESVRMNSVITWPMKSSLFTISDTAVLGTSGDDIIREENESIIYHVYGGDGNDKIFTSDSADIIQGGKGIDSINGGAGSDIYHYYYGDGTDVIQDAEADPDSVDSDSEKFGDYIYINGFPQNTVFSILFTSQYASILGDNQELMRVLTRDSEKGVFFVQSDTGWSSYIDFNENHTTLLNFGMCGEKLTWTLADTGLLTISGTGDMYDYESSSSVPWYQNRSSIKSISISDNVTSIGEYAFCNCTNLTIIDIPDSIISIGDYAFKKCGIASLILSNGVNISGVYSLIIGKYAFSDCDELVSVKIEDKDGKSCIEDYAFYDCDSLTSLTIDVSYIQLGNYVFYECGNLSSVSLGKTQIQFGHAVFCYCNKLKSMEIDNALLADAAFYRCGLTSISIENVVIVFGNPFKGALSLQTINISGYSCDGAFIYGSKLVSFPADRSGHYAVPKSVTCIGDEAFFESKLTSIEIPTGVTSIGENAFYCCNNLTSITIGDDLTSIGNGAFEGCTGLTSIEIPASVTSIGWCAFKDCSSLKYVLYSGSRAQWNKISIDTNNEYLKNARIICADEISTTVEIERHGLRYNLMKEKVALCLNSDEKVSIYITPGTESLYESAAKYSLIQNSKTVGTSTTGKFENILPSEIFAEEGTVYYAITDSEGRIFEKQALLLSFQNEYTIKYSLGYTPEGEDSDIYCTQKIIAGKEISQPDKPTREGYKFQGWYANPQFTGYQYFSLMNQYNRIHIENDIKLYAKWEKTDLEIGHDTWTINNNDCYFIQKTGDNYEISAGDYNKLTEGLSLSEKYQIWVKKNMNWSGSCFGLSSFVVLSSDGAIDISNFDAKCSELGEASLTDNQYGDDDVGTVESAINFYFLRQYLRTIYDTCTDYEKESNESSNIQKIIQKMKTCDAPVLLNVKLSGSLFKSGLHAVVAYDLEKTNQGYAFKVYDCNCPVTDYYTVDVTIENGVYKKSCEAWLDRYKYTYYNTIYLLSVLSADDLKSLPYLVAPGVVEGSYSTGTSSSSGKSTLRSKYTSFSISDGINKAVITNGEKVSGDLDIQCNGLVNLVSQDTCYGFTLPDSSSDYTITEVTGSGEITLSNSDQSSGFYSSYEGGSFESLSFGSDGSVSSVCADSTEQSVTVCRNDMSTPWFDVTVSGSSSALSVEPAADKVSVSSAEETTVDIELASQFNSLQLENVQVSSQDIQIAQGTGCSCEITSGETVLANETYGYSVAFDSGVGSQVETMCNVESGSLITEPSTPAATGYVFEGWYKDEELTSEWDFATDTVTADLILHAKWSVDPDYLLQVVFRVSEKEDQTVYITKGSTISRDYAPLGENGEIYDWYTNYDYTGDVWNFDDDVLESNVVLYGKTVPCTVSFELGNGQTIESVQTYKGTLLSEPAVTAASGSTLCGWYLDEEFTEPWDFESDRINGDMTLYAKWTYTVTFNLALPDTATGSAFVTIDGGTATPIPEEGLVCSNLTGKEIIKVTATPDTECYSEIYTDEKTFAISYNGTAVTCQLTADDIKANATIKVEFTVNPLPIITSQPESCTVDEDGTATLYVSAAYSGDGELTYLWQYCNYGTESWSSASNISTSYNSATLTIENVQTSLNGCRFKCIITAPNGKIIETDVAVVKVVVTRITSQPVSCTVDEEGTATFSVSATYSGEGELTYLWQFYNDSTKQWSSASGISASYNTATLTIENVQTSLNDCRFRCVITAPNGKNVETDEATVTVTPIPKITSQPASCTVDEAGTATLSVSATYSGEGDLTYLWQFYNDSTEQWESASSISTSYNTATLIIDNVKITLNDCIFRCVIATPNGKNVETDEATVTVTPIPQITSQPASCTVDEEGTATFSVSATYSGEGDLTYLWQFYNDSAEQWESASDISTSYSTATLTIENVQTSLNDCSFRCVITAPNGKTAESDEAVVTVVVKNNAISASDAYDITGATAVIDVNYSVTSETAAKEAYIYVYYGTDDLDSGTGCRCYEMTANKKKSFELNSLVPNIKYNYYAEIHYLENETEEVVLQTEVKSFTTLDEYTVLELDKPVTITETNRTIAYKFTATEDNLYQFKLDTTSGYSELKCENGTRPEHERLIWLNSGDYIYYLAETYDGDGVVSVSFAQGNAVETGNSINQNELYSYTLPDDEYPDGAQIELSILDSEGTVIEGWHLQYWKDSDYDEKQYVRDGKISCFLKQGETLNFISGHDGDMTVSIELHEPASENNVTVSEVKNITGMSAEFELDISITPDTAEKSPEVWLECGTSPTLPYYNIGYEVLDADDACSNFKISQKCCGFIPDTTYYYRAVIQYTEDGTTYTVYQSDIKSFTTLDEYTVLELYKPIQITECNKEFAFKFTAPESNLYRFAIDAQDSWGSLYYTNGYGYPFNDEAVLSAGQSVYYIVTCYGDSLGNVSVTIPVGESIESGDAAEIGGLYSYTLPEGEYETGAQVEISVTDADGNIPANLSFSGWNVSDFSSRSYSQNGVLYFYLKYGEKLNIQMPTYSSSPEITEYKFEIKLSSPATEDSISVSDVEISDATSARCDMQVSITPETAEKTTYVLLMCDRDSDLKLNGDDPDITTALQYSACSGRTVPCTYFSNLLPNETHYYKAVIAYRENNEWKVVKETETKQFTVPDVYTEIKLDEAQTITESSKYHLFKFTATEDGIYKISTDGQYGSVYACNTDGKTVSHYLENGKVCCSLKKDDVVYLWAYMYYGTSTSVTVSKMTAENLGTCTAAETGKLYYYELPADEYSDGAFARVSLTDSEGNSIAGTYLDCWRDGDVNASQQALGASEAFIMNQGDRYYFIVRMGYNVSADNLQINFELTDIKKMGDLDNDGEITVTDIHMLRRAAAGLTTLTDYQKSVGDVYYDGRYNSLDVNLLRRYVARLVTAIPYIKA